MTRKQANALLPEKPTQAEINPSNLVIEVIAPRKWGKTEFFMSNEDAILLAFETGHKFQRGHKIEIEKWDQRRGEYKMWVDDEGVRHMTAMQALEVLTLTRKFGMVIVDTIDMAVKMSSDYHCEVARVEDPSDMGDFGKGWNKAINNPIRKFILGLAKTGRGVAILTHSKTVIERFTSGERARKEASVGGGVKSFIESQADVIMHGEFGKKRNGKRLRDRVLVCEGDMDTLAGNRSGAMLPERYIVRKGHQWAQFHSFFTDPTAADKAEAFYRKVSKRSK